MNELLDSIYHLNNIFHTIVGSIALIGGVFALAVTKGSDTHKKAGIIFVWLLGLSAVTSLYPTFYKFREIGPVAVIMATATVYLLATALMAIRNQSEIGSTWEKGLVIVPAVLIILPIIRVIMALKTGNYEIFVGPIVLACLFGYLIFSDIQILRNRRRDRAYWLNRHMTRMVFAFAFGIMALVRIGIDFGLTFEMSVVIPLMAATLLIMFLRQRFKH